jgi:hypothetical protein
MYNEALSIARAQKAKSLELRTGLKLARLRQKQGRPEAAINLLKPLCSWCTEGVLTCRKRERCWNLAFENL